MTKRFSKLNIQQRYSPCKSKKPNFKSEIEINFHKNPNFHLKKIPKGFCYKKNYAICFWNGFYDKSAQTYEHCYTKILMFMECVTCHLSHVNFQLSLIALLTPRVLSPAKNMFTKWQMNNTESLVYMSGVTCQVSDFFFFYNFLDLVSGARSSKLSVTAVLLSM